MIDTRPNTNHITTFFLMHFAQKKRRNSTMGEKDGYSMLDDGLLRAMSVSSNAMMADVWSRF